MFCIPGSDREVFKQILEDASKNCDDLDFASISDVDIKELYGINPFKVGYFLSTFIFINK